jgi:hypothetical protein
MFEPKISHFFWHLSATLVNDIMTLLTYIMWYYCAVTGESKKIVFTNVGQRKKSRVAEPRVIFGVKIVIRIISENNF